MLCSIDQCSKKAVARGWCNAHYKKFHKYGDPLGGVRTWGTCSQGHDLSLPKSKVMMTNGPTCRKCLQIKGRTVNLKKYNLTVASWEALFEAQGERCLICERDESEIERGLWCVDHDHACCAGPFSCGKCVRGILCFQCNRWMAPFDSWTEVQFQRALELSGRNVVATDTR